LWFLLVSAKKAVQAKLCDAGDDMAMDGGAVRVGIRLASAATGDDTGSITKDQLF